MTRTYEPKVLGEGIVFGEGPRWRDGRLWLSDMYGLRVVTVDLQGKVETVVEVPQQPSGLGWLADGDLLIVSMLDRRLLRLAGGRLVTHADLSDLFGSPANDMVVDSGGRAYVGSFGSNIAAGESFKTSAIVMVSDDGKACAATDDTLAMPNGIVVSEDGTKLIVAETFGQRLSVFDVAADGSLKNQRTFAELPGRTPDGICLDADGAVWAACFGQDEFVRVHEGGEISETVPVPGRRAVACTLGGDDRRTLFLLTAETTLEELGQGKSKGYVEMTQVETAGAGLP